MDFKKIKPGRSVSLFVKDIFIFEEKNKKQQTELPFFADGYPGLMFQETVNGLFVNPHNKKMPVLFLYGQTIRPIELVIKGSYKLIVFQLYPFVLKSFFGVDPRGLNDECFDLAQIKNTGIKTIINGLQDEPDFANRIKMITAFLKDRFETKKEMLDLQVLQAINLIINNKGQLTIGQLCKELHLTERTLERRFVNEVGISPKQFSVIIKFQQSLEQLSVRDFSKLTDIVYSNGFADQSHFIRVFKAFTGKTPKNFSVKPN